MVNVQRKELKSGALDAKFTAADHNGKIISVSDNVKVLEGSLKVCSLSLSFLKPSTVGVLHIK